MTCVSLYQINQMFRLEKHWFRKFRRSRDREREKNIRKKRLWISFLLSNTVWALVRIQLHPFLNHSVHPHRWLNCWKHRTCIHRFDIHILILFAAFSLTSLCFWIRYIFNGRERIFYVLHWINAFDKFVNCIYLLT